VAGFDYGAAIDNVISILQAANTTTAAVDLSDGLNDRVIDDNIIASDPNIVIVKSDRLPAVFVRIPEGSEDYADIGETGPSGNLKYKDVTFDIFAMCAKAGATSDYASLLKQGLKFAQNIEAVFQNNITLGTSQTPQCVWCNPAATAISNIPIDGVGTWVKTVLVELKAKYMFR